MEKYKEYKVPAFIALALVLTACSTLCFVQKRFVVAAASKVAEKGKCKKPSVIEKKFNGVLSKITDCDRLQTGAVADIVCKPLSGFISSIAINTDQAKAFLAEAECDPLTSMSAIAEGFEAACRLIPVDDGEGVLAN